MNSNPTPPSQAIRVLVKVGRDGKKLGSPKNSSSQPTNQPTNPSQIGEGWIYRLDLTCFHIGITGTSRQNPAHLGRSATTVGWMVPQENKAFHVTCVGVIKIHKRLQTWMGKCFFDMFKMCLGWSLGFWGGSKEFVDILV